MQRALWSCRVIREILYKAHGRYHTSTWEILYEHTGDTAQAHGRYRTKHTGDTVRAHRRYRTSTREVPYKHTCRFMREGGEAEPKPSVSPIKGELRTPLVKFAGSVHISSCSTRAVACAHTHAARNGSRRAGSCFQQNRPAAQSLPHSRGSCQAKARRGCRSGRQGLMGLCSHPAAARTQHRAAMPAWLPEDPDGPAPAAPCSCSLDKQGNKVR